MATVGFGLRVTHHEFGCFCVAPAAAPVVAALILRSLSDVLIVAVVSYIAAFTLGLPLFIWLRCAHSLATSSLFAAVVAGSLAGMLLVTFALLAVLGARLFANPATVVTLIGVGALWGAGFGLVSGLALFTLLRRGEPQAHKG